MAKFARADIRRILGEACTDEIENELIALHIGVVDPLKDELAEIKKKVDTEESDYKTKYESEKEAFAKYKADVEAKETSAAKEAAVRRYFDGKNIKGANLEIAMRGARKEIDGVELDGERIKDTKSLDELISGTYKGLVSREVERGVDVAKPIANTGGKRSKDEIIAIKDPAERQKAIMENHELFGI